MLINLSNHPSSKWNKEQTEAAKRQFGEIIDLPFPAVAPDGDENYIAALADEYCNKVIELAGDAPVTVHLMGEMTLTFALVNSLADKGVTCVASTTERIVKEIDDDHKDVVFQFVRFRNYL